MKTKTCHLTAEIDLSAISHNCNLLKKIAGNPRLCVAAKCNAYGHGIDIVLPAFEAAGVDMLGVATIAEADQLLELGWKKPILLFGSEFSIYQSEQKQEVACRLVNNEIRLTAMRDEDVEFISTAAKKLKKPAKIHLSLDTGMCRMGLNEENLLSLIDKIAKEKTIEIEGFYTHFASADETDRSFADLQLRRFKDFNKKLLDRNIKIPIVHAANSAAVLNLTDVSFNMIRPGIAVYGYAPLPGLPNSRDLKPAMKVISCLTVIKKIPKGSYVGYGCTWRADKDTVIGLVPIGYGDGYDRRLSNRGLMKIDSDYVPVIGRVSMDQTIVDLTAIFNKNAKVAVGSEIVIIDNNRDSKNSVESIANMLQTIPYEIVTRIGPRVKRVPVYGS
ncbi:MAG: alanine racemase [Sedimentisphaerales bacterium]